MTNNPDVTIIGGGVAGAACAREISASGESSVLLIDAGYTDGVATSASAGMLAALAEASPDDAVLALNVRARDIYLELVPELEEETGIDVGLWTGGILQAVFSAEEVSRIKNGVARLRQSGFAADWLSSEDMRSWAPGLNEEVQGGILAPDDGSISPSGLRDAFLESARQRRVEIREGVRARGLRIDGDRVTGVLTDDGDIQTGAVVVAAGSWSGRLEGLPRPLSVEPVKGQMAAVQLTEEKPRSIVYGTHVYVLSGGCEAMIGATVEHVGFESEVTNEGIKRICDAASHLFPELAEAPLLRTWAGLRPGSPDGLPFIGPDPDVENLWYATGHGRNGILLAGLTGRLVANGFGGEEPLDDRNLECVSPSRFWKTHVRSTLS